MKEMTLKSEMETDELLTEKLHNISIHFEFVWYFGGKMTQLGKYVKEVILLLIPVAARSNAWLCGLSLAEIVGSNPTSGVDVYCDCGVLSGMLCLSEWCRKFNSKDV